MPNFTQISCAQFYSGCSLQVLHTESKCNIGDRSHSVPGMNNRPSVSALRCCKHAVWFIVERAQSAEKRWMLMLQRWALHANVFPPVEFANRLFKLPFHPSSLHSFSCLPFLSGGCTHWTVPCAAVLHSAACNTFSCEDNMGVSERQLAPTFSFVLWLLSFLFNYCSAQYIFTWQDFWFEWYWRDIQEFLFGPLLICYFTQNVVEGNYD